MMPIHQKQTNKKGFSFPIIKLQARQFLANDLISILVRVVWGSAGLFPQMQGYQEGRGRGRSEGWRQRCLALLVPG